MAEERLGSLSRSKVVVVGAGEVGEAAAVALAGRGVAELVVANRTAERGAALAARTGGRVVASRLLADELATADVVVTCTGAELPVIDHDLMSSVVARRSARPLLVLDIAVPRDVERRAAGLPGVTVLDIEDLSAWADRGAGPGRRGRRCGRSWPGRSTATSTMRRPGGGAPSSARCTTGPSTCARPSWPASSAS
jgi:glutamyl-tRNA reductase